MVEGRESVLYALPFCAGTVTGIFLCGHDIFHSPDSYRIASVSMTAGIGLAVPALLAGGRVGQRAKVILAAAAAFFCGIFCWSNHEVINIGAAGRGGSGLIEKAAAPAASSSSGASGMLSPLATL